MMGVRARQLSVAAIWRQHASSRAAAACPSPWHAPATAAATEPVHLGSFVSEPANAANVSCSLRRHARASSGRPRRSAILARMA